MKKQNIRKWFTMSELRELQDDELINMAIELGGSDEWRRDKDRGDVLAFIMGSQITMRDQGFKFTEGGKK